MYIPNINKKKQRYFLVCRECKTYFANIISSQRNYSFCSSLKTAKNALLSISLIEHVRQTEYKCKQASTVFTENIFLADSIWHADRYMFIYFEFFIMFICISKYWHKKIIVFVVYLIRTIKVWLLRKWVTLFVYIEIDSVQSESRTHWHTQSFN